MLFRSLETVSADVRAVVTSAAFADKVRAFGVTPTGTTPAELDAWVRGEIGRWQEIVKAANLKAD